MTSIYKKITISDALYNSKPSYNRLAEIQNTIKNSRIPIEFEFDIQQRVGLTFILCISAIPLIAKKYKKSVKIRCNHKILTLLHKCGYIDCFIDNNKEDISSLLKKSYMFINTSDDVLNLISKITTDAPVQMSEQLKAIFTSKIGEIFNNSLEHADSRYILGAKYFKNQKNLYCFSCYDLGVGIPQKVIDANLGFTDQAEAFKWALGTGNSTATKDRYVARGLGLGLLKSFARANGGTIRICSNKILYQFKCVNKQASEKFYKLDSSFEGTLFEMDIITDNKHQYIID